MSVFAFEQKKLVFLLTSRYFGAWTYKMMLVSFNNSTRICHYFEEIPLIRLIKTKILLWFAVFHLNWLPLYPKSNICHKIPHFLHKLKSFGLTIFTTHQSLLWFYDLPSPGLAHSITVTLCTCVAWLLEPLPSAPLLVVSSLIPDSLHDVLISMLTYKKCQPNLIVIAEQTNKKTEMVNGR